jgi:hypothetical protein
MRDGLFDFILYFGSFVLLMLISFSTAIYGWISNWRTAKARSYLEHEQWRLKQGLPVHEKCECKACVTWRREHSR